MIMPVRQDCPRCGESFMGSDAIGGLCPRCELEDKGAVVKDCQTCQGRGWLFSLDHLDKFFDEKNQINE